MVGSADEEPTGKVAVSPEGNLHLASYSDTSTSFFAVPGTSVAGGRVHFARYNGLDGSLLASASLGAGARVADIAVDSVGNTYLVGLIDSVTDFGNGPGPARGLYILKLDTAGSVLWSRQFPELLGGFRESFRHITYDASTDSVLVSGAYTDDGGVGFDLGLGPMAGNIEGYFVARFDSDGTTLDQADAFSEVGPIAVAPNGDVAMFGFYGFDDQLFLPGAIISTPDLAGAFFALFDGDLDFLNVQIGAGAGFNSEYGVAASSDGTYWVSSEQGNDVPGAPGSVVNSGNFVAHYDASGEYLAHRELQGDANPQAISVTPDGSPVVVGNFTQGADVGTGPLTPSQGIFTARYDAALAPTWVRLGETTSSFALNLHDVDANGTGVAISGQVSGNSMPDIGLGPASGYGDALDSFIAILQP